MCVCVCVCEWAYGTGYDERRRQGLAGPEMMAIREEKARAIAAEAYEQKRAERLAAGLPAPFDFTQRHMRYLRRAMGADLLSQRLMHTLSVPN